VFIYFISPSHQASLTPPHLNEVHARSHESDQDVRGERSCICMLGVRGHVYVYDKYRLVITRK
jgi:hypothetical protein